MAKLRSLPDIFPISRPRILFIGTSPGKRSAIDGHYYAGFSNIFWKLLFESGLTKKLLKPSQFRQLIYYGYGLTDVVKIPTIDQGKINEKYALKHILKLNRRLRTHKPKIAAFVSKKAYRVFTQDKDELNYGIQYQFNKYTTLFLLPSTSGQSYNDTKYSEKLKWFKELKKHL